MPDNISWIKATRPYIFLVATDFLKYNPGQIYDRIIANPPFTKNQDIAHIRHMYNCLKPGGLMVTLCSPHYQFCNNKQEIYFRDWLKDVKAHVTDIEPGRFKESGTMIRTVKIAIVKV